MDLRSDNVGGVVGGVTIDTAINAVKSLQEKAILKKAKKLAMAGEFDKLTGRMIDIMIENGVDPSMYNKSKTWLARPGNQKVGESTAPIPANTPVETETVENKFKMYLPYIVGALLLGVIIFIIVKHK